MAIPRRIGEVDKLNLLQKLAMFNWGLLFLLTLVACIGFAMLYSAANGQLEPWSARQIVRYAVGIAVMLIVALVDIRFWMRHAYSIYLAALALLVVVEFAGSAGMGARRWIDLGFMQLQPSEVMKIALVLAIARYFHAVAVEDIGRIRVLFAPLLLMALPIALVLRQPDLGTAVVLILITGTMMFVAGIRLWKFATALLLGLGAIPLIWPFLHEYQRQRVLTYLDPSRDPLGAGYHITQSKIALGAGGTTGRGYLQGTQSHLSFLPERHTDFIFTMLAEEFGLIGSLGLMALYLVIIAYTIAIATQSKNHFGRLLVLGISSTFFVYIAVNVAMVTGIVPVVGIPLPLISYGGTAMLTLLAGFGLISCVYIHRGVTIPRREH